MKISCQAKIKDIYMHMKQRLGCETFVTFCLSRNQKSTVAQRRSGILLWMIQKYSGGKQMSFIGT